MLHKISLQTCCCDQQPPGPVPTGILGTALLNLGGILDIVAVGPCTAIDQSAPFNFMQIQWQLFDGTTDRFHHFYTNDEIRNKISAFTNLVWRGDVHFGGCEWSNEIFEPQNDFIVTVVLRAISGPNEGPPFHWDLSLQIDAGGQGNQQVFLFSSNPQQAPLDPAVATPLTIDNVFIQPAGAPTPPAVAVTDSLYDQGLSFMAVTGSS